MADNKQSAPSQNKTALQIAGEIDAKIITEPIELGEDEKTTSQPEGQKGICPNCGRSGKLADYELQPPASASQTAEPSREPRCPECGSKRIGIFESRAEGCVNVVKCPDCKSQWTNSGLYELGEFFPSRTLPSAECIAEKQYEIEMARSYKWENLDQTVRDAWISDVKSMLEALASISGEPQNKKKE